MPHPATVFGGVSFRLIIPAPLTSDTALLHYLGVSPAELKKIWWFRHRMYRDFAIPKGKGKVRIINAPDDRLKMLQRYIAELLKQIYSPRNPVHGFVDDRSVRTNAAAHLRSKFAVNLDIENFFVAISENRIAGLLTALGVNEAAAQIVARICCNRGHLPQGAPSSPILSNMICFRLDKDLLAIAKASRCIYTRYADDITFSSYQPPTGLFENGIPSTGNFAPELLSAPLNAAFTNNGFKINPDKAHYADRNSRRTVTGLKINNGLNVDRRLIRNIRSTLYSVEKLGLADAQKKFHDEYGGKHSIAGFLKGKIAWVGNVKGRADPVYRGLAARFNKSFSSTPIKLLIMPEQIRERAVWVIEHWEKHGDQLGAQGSAFFLKSVGLVTAWHCVEAAHKAGSKIELYHPSERSKSFVVKVVKFCKFRDLAILEHSLPANEFYEFDDSNRNFVAGEQITALGYPGFGAGDGLNIRPGHISGFPVKHAVPLIEVTQKLAQGMSGGPVTDSDHRVAGVIHKGGPLEARDFAVHIKALLALAAGK